MRTRTLLSGAALLAFAAGCGQTTPPPSAAPEAPAAPGFRAVASEVGGVDDTGPYQVADWPKPLAQLPGHEKWTWGAMETVFAESPDRVLAIQLGELPALQRP